MCCHLINGITSLENDVMDKTHPLASHHDRYSFIATAFFMTYTCLGFVTPIAGEVSLGPIGNAHQYKPCKQCD